MKLYLDPGHGGNDPGAQGKGLKEKDITLAIALHIQSILKHDYTNADVKMSRSSDKTVSLAQRTNEANNWGADYFLSIHCNSFNGSAQGYEDYIHNSLSDSSKTADYQATIHKEVVKQNELRDRGKKKADYHVLRESAMPALLTENGFIDHTHDAALMKKDAWLKKVAQGHVNGLEKIFQLKKKHNSPKTIYRVIAGSFSSKANAKKRVDMLKQKSIEAFVDAITISGKQWYRVQAGAFSEQKNAKEQLKKVVDAGVKDAFIAKEDR
ncbi:N-acetylmuramoyl-L-alanine amidase [Lentibacillus sp. N15]|uniref:N-acetylmuramoyl-L-alanine amidase n=1 Tax=Lentibacillus songyuanensis TaxID=3136161 RepID=UPI0031BB3D7B